jgi:hypothetical protein
MGENDLCEFSEETMITFSELIIIERFSLFAS